MQSYNSKPLGSAPPHIYAIADTAYRALNTENADQAVLISGESGSGKTEAKKLILEYLASVASKEAPPPPTLRAEGQDDDDEEASEPEPEAPVDSTARRGPPPQEQVMAANPILEAFGNAKTLRNHNSSRFGNLCEVQFDEGGFLIGASLKHYLLEKTRVTVQSPGERNFHVFYYVCSGADKNERERWRIGPATDYNYINRSGCIDIPQLDSRIEFGSLKRALAVAGISPPEQQLIFNLIAALLHLGNTTSFFTDDLDVATLSASGQQNAQWVAYLLQCDPVALMQGMLYRENIINNETFAVPLTRAQAFDAIDSLARQLYGRQFDWLVRRLDSLSNVETQPELNLKVKQRISLLDIFGFEVFDVNSFEQFCINFANEVLQLQFNNYIFKLEQQEYAREGLRLEDFTYQDNKPTIDLFSKRPVGMMMLLDEECRFPRSSDQSYVTKLVAAHEKHPNFKKHRFNQNMFNVVHFAGEVEYTVNNFLEKNRETLSNLFVRAIKSSTCPYYAGLVADVDDTVALRRKTQGAQFQEQLGTLMTHLGACSPHYVRCIKPNRQQVCDVFERDHVLRQLRYAGVLETVRIRGAGFPNRRLLPAFLARYCPLVSLALQQRIGAALVGVSPLLLRQEADAATAAALSSGAKPKAIEGALDAADDVAATSAAAAAVVSAQLTDSQRVQLSALATEVLRELNVKPGASCVGKTKVFVRDAAFHALEGARNAFFFQAAARIQARWRGFTLRRYFLRQRQAVRYLQQWLRYYLTTQDRTAEVEGALKTISGKGIGGSNSAAAVKQLESLCKREKNVETVIEQGGIGAIVNAMGSAQGKTDDERREMLTAGTRALGRMAISQENAALVARGGAVRSMLRTIDSVKDNSSFQGATRNAVQLIDHLSKVDKNVEVVVREGGVATLTSVLRAAGGAQKGSEDEQGNSMTSAAKALGTLTKNERVARVLGRDHEAIKTVIDSINSKPKFSSLVSYSINCLGNMVQNKHNLDSVVECGGIETVIRMMELHPDSDKVCFSRHSKARIFWM
jgi:myosin heavy subunit